MSQKLLLCFLLCALLFSQAWAQSRSVTGKVLDPETNQGLPGVNVFIKGTTSGTVTDDDGNYKLEVPSGSTILVFSSVGFSTQEVNIGDQSVIDVTMVAVQLEEIVVTGLATSVKRSNLANAVSTISGAELTGTTRPQTLDGAMNGKIAGASISANSGAPGGGFSVKLRGVSTIGFNQNSEPLYIVDGVYINNSQFQTGAGTSAFSGATGQTAGTQDQATNRIADINPADIENVEILKGPSAAAIYGTRANAGVIIITTKKGKTGKTNVQFSQDLGFAKALRLIGMHETPWDLDKISKGIWLVSNSTMANLFTANGSGSKTTNYEKLIYGNTGFLRTTRLNVSGGTDKFRFLVAGAVMRENGIQKRTGFDRNSLRANLDFKVNKFINISTGTNFINSSTSRSFSGNDNNGVSLGYNLAYLPNWLDQNPVNGVYPANPLTGQNPLQIVDRAENNEKTNRFIQSFNGTIQIINKANHSLRYSMQGGFDFLLTESEVYMPDDLQFQLQRANPGASRYTKNRAIAINLQGFLVDELKVGDFNFNTSLGAIRLSNNIETNYIQGEGLKAGQRNPGTALVQTPFVFFSRYQEVGIVAQEEINWKDRVIITGGIRFDKSNLNGDVAKYNPFARVSAAVNITKFDFWAIKAINLLKARFAYGQTGNPASFGSKFTSLVPVIIDGKAGVASPVTNGNPVISPETANEFETGLDIGLLDGRINLELTYYNKNVKNFIDAFPLAPTSGVNSISAFPVGDFRNRGIEIGLNATAVKVKDVTWNTTLNFWLNRSKITRLIVPEFAVGSSGFGAFGTNRIRLNESPTRWYGTPLVEGQRTGYEDAQPKFQMSWLNNITFLKNFEFSFLLHWSHKNYNASLNQELTDEGGTSPDWANLSANGTTPVGVARQLGQTGITTRQFIVDASYIKLREVAIYYNLPKNYVPKFVESVRIGASGNNLFMWTPYYGYDPEASNFGNRPVGTGVDLLSFPSSRRVFFHINVNF